MSERIPEQNKYEMQIDVAAQRVLEIITEVENMTSDAAVIRARLLSAQTGEPNQLVKDVLSSVADIFKTMAASRAESPTQAAGFDANTAYVFASPYVATSVKEVFKQLINQGIGTKR